MDFVILANSWDAGRDNPTSKHRIACALAAAGHRVLWCEGAGMRSPNPVSGDDRSRIMRKVKRAFSGAVAIHGHDPGGISVIAPLSIPLPASGVARVINGLLYRRAILRHCGAAGFMAPVLINYTPVLGHVFSRPGGRKFFSRQVYHCVDRWDAFRMYNSGVMREMDRMCCSRADVVIASSDDLFRRCAAINPNTFLVEHGVDHRHFSKSLEFRAGSDAERAVRRRAAGLPGGRIAGFFGLISEWVDQELLVECARSIPDCNILLIGKADVASGALAAVPGIRIIGPRPFSELPRYISFFDIGLIPFKVNDLTVAVNPIKLREMLSAGCPVVSTDLPEVVKYASRCPVAGAVSVESSAGDFVRRVSVMLDRGFSESERAEISRGMAGETWDEKTRRIVQICLS